MKELSNKAIPKVSRSLLADFSKERENTDVGSKVKKSILYILLVLGAATMLIPFIWMVSTSLKTPGETVAMPRFGYLISYR